MIIIISIIASIAAFAGGQIALKYKDRLHIILGLSAGTVIGAALFDLIPESIEIGSGIWTAGQITAFTGAGFLTYLVLDRIFSFHDHSESLEIHDHEQVGQEHATSRRGSFGAASFCLHSLMDGIAIGTAFQASSAIGTIVAVAVVAHRFSDGINTVGVILKHRGATRNANHWLIAVAVAPIIGAFSTFFFSVSNQGLAVLLSVFAGFFLYIGASDLIPEGNHSHSKLLNTFATILGALILYVIVQIAG